jgi:molecular chaperone GrpE
MFRNKRMARGNGKTDIDEGNVPLDIEHELPAATEDDPVATAPDVQAASLEELDRLKAERDVLFDRLARLQAEFDNYRKRAAREQAEFKQYAVADAVKALLPVLDSLERALRTSEESSELHAGLELILRQFNDVLGKLGVQPIRAEGQPFDPNQHQAVEVVESSAVPDQHVIEELQRGYRIKDRLLRPSMVRVARKPQQ